MILPQVERSIAVVGSLSCSDDVQDSPDERVRTFRKPKVVQWPFGSGGSAATRSIVASPKRPGSMVPAKGSATDTWLTAALAAEAGRFWSIQSPSLPPWP